MVLLDLLSQLLLDYFSCQEKGGVLCRGDKILSLLFISEPSHNLYPKNGKEDMLLALSDHMQLSQLRFLTFSGMLWDPIWHERLGHTHIIYCEDIFPPSRRNELNFLDSRVRVEVGAFLVNVEYLLKR